jgi:small subunit ribosomal protein S9
MAGVDSYGTGKRKTAVARVFLRSGSGGFEINRRAIESYFPNHLHRMVARTALVVTETLGQMDVKASVAGGGSSGQADALRHGVARALLRMNPELRKLLRGAGLLTRDSRIKERKKYGQPGARKRFQFSKR